jgi:hypothetical protein
LLTLFVVPYLYLLLDVAKVRLGGLVASSK